MTTSKHGIKKVSAIAWILVLVGMVLAADGLIQLMGGNTARMGQASLGGVLMMASTVFFIWGRRQPEPDTSKPA
ncbi:MAG: hypothetical protein EX271_09275 [Acidimicrobiales bacterium]|nr:hypothetical protein [Hyphomonadaceae bacterium]RZV40869.1 MAG: hypothetical protein EX271_09275 [Acidimicrobiales bacterium]